MKLHTIITIGTTKSGSIWRAYPDRHSVEDVYTMAHNIQRFGGTLTEQAKAIIHSYASFYARHTQRRLWRMEKWELRFHPDYHLMTTEELVSMMTPGEPGYCPELGKAAAQWSRHLAEPERKRPLNHCQIWKR
jgi:hypothetical protein